MGGAASGLPINVTSAEQAETFAAAFLKLCGKPFPEDAWSQLKGCINAVFRSWNSGRAVEYRKHAGGDFGIGTAVNIQWMFPSAVSGIVFTRSPSEPETDTMLVEAAFGLGEAVVSGDTEPDRFTLSRADVQVLASVQGAKGHVVPALGAAACEDPQASLTPTQLADLGRLALRIEDFMEAPQDIEFGWDGREFALLQCRPIRGLETALVAAGIRKDAIAKLEAEFRSGTRLRVLHNLGETLPFPTPLTWDLVRFFMSGAGGMGKLYRMMGTPYPDDQAAEFLDLVCGRIYADPDRMVSLLWKDLPVICDAERLQADLSQLENPPLQFAPESTDTLFLLRLPARLFSLARSGLRTRRLRKTAARDFDDRTLPRFLEYLQAQRAIELTSLSDDELIRLFRERRNAVLQDFAGDSLIPGFIGAAVMAELSTLLVRLTGPDGIALCRRLITAGSPVAARQRTLLADVGDGKREIEDFIAEFGHRAPGEMELSVPRWRESPDVIKRMTEQCKAAPQHRNEDPLSDLDERLAAEGARSYSRRVRRLAAAASDLLQYRETGKDYLMMGYELLRDCAVELDRRWALDGLVFFITWEELLKGPSGITSLRDELPERRLRYEAAQRLRTGAVITGDDVAQLGVSATTDPSARKATPISPGLATGMVCIMHSSTEDRELPENCILVCESTDPGWMPLLARSTGLVVERGGILSHGALIARDLGIPALVLPDATSVLKDGQVITLDGATGSIQEEAGQA
jgi:pyruvate,water dikinase